MADVEFEDVVELALQLDPADQARLMERLASAMRDISTNDLNADDAQEWTDAEIAEMLTVQPMTGAEIVTAGLVGGWEDLNIQDGAEWVNEQKRRW